MAEPGPPIDEWVKYAMATKELRAAELIHRERVSAANAELEATQKKWREALDALNKAILGG